MGKSNAASLMQQLQILHLFAAERRSAHRCSVCLCRYWSVLPIPLHLLEVVLTLRPSIHYFTTTLPRSMLEILHKDLLNYGVMIKVRIDHLAFMPKGAPRTSGKTFFFLKKGRFLRRSGNILPVGGEFLKMVNARTMPVSQHYLHEASRKSISHSSQSRTHIKPQRPTTWVQRRYALAVQLNQSSLSGWRGAYGYRTRVSISRSQVTHTLMDSMPREAGVEAVRRDTN